MAQDTRTQASGETTKPIRISVSRVEEFKAYLAKDIYKPGIQCNKTGVLLDDLHDKRMLQRDLLMPID